MALAVDHTPVLRAPLAWSVAALFAVALFIAPALWNGFPIIYPDSGGYLARPLTGTLELGRSAFYGLLLLIGRSLDFWPVILAQAALLAWLIALVLRAHALARPLIFAAIAVLLAVATSLPWFATQLMPDVFFPAVALALYLLAFGGDRISAAERAGLCMVIAVAMMSHMAALGLCLGVIAILLPATRLRAFALPRARLALLALTVAVGVLLSPLSNLAITGQFAFTPGGTNFLFARLIEDGIVQRYLADHCPDPQLRICPYRGELTEEADDWLWKNDTAFYKLGGWQGHSAEERRIILATLALYPFAHIKTALVASVRQFGTFQTEFVVNPWHNAPAIGTLSELAPGALARLLDARQQAAPVNIAAINWLHVPAGALAIMALAAALVFRRRFAVAPQTAALALTMLATLAVNAVICGIFSHPVDRYQSRLMPVAVLAAAIVWLSRRTRKAV